MTRIDNISLVGPERVIGQGWLLMEGDTILETGSGSPPSAERLIDGFGMYALPGFIDLHSDALEGETQPRPGVFFEPEFGLSSLESKLVCHGVTSMFHSLSFHDTKISIRSRDMVSKIIHSIRDFNANSLIRHKVHARYEISEVSALPCICELMDKGLVHMLSLMNHSPGQGQYCDMDKYRSNLRSNRGLSGPEAEQWIRERQSRMENPEIPAAMRTIASHALSAGLPLASHDDETVAKVKAMAELGVSISEFPINLESALAARACGMHIAVGAPNVLRGLSNSGNMRAIDAIEAGAADILCSDYVPPSILHAVFKLHRDYAMPLHEACAMASLKPAQAVGLADELGSLEAGKRADLVLVDASGEYPRVSMVFIDGNIVLSKGRHLPTYLQERENEAETVCGTACSR